MAKGASKIGGSGGTFTPIENAIDFNNKLQAEKYFGEQKFSLLEEAGLWFYTSDTDSTLNSYLRTGKNKPDDADLVPHIDSAIAGSTLRDPIVVHRGMDVDAFGFDYTNMPKGNAWQQFVGRTFKDKGYVSTAAGDKGFSRMIQVDITVPAGKGRGVYIGQKSSHPTESEYLIKRGSKFRITGVSTDSNGQVKMSMQMMG